MPARFSPEERFEYLKQFGSHCMAYSTLQPAMDYFDLPGVGYLAYMTHARTRFVLAEPICAEADRPRLIGEALREHPDTCFVQVRQPTAKILHEGFGFYATHGGIESGLDLQTWESKGNKKQILRSALNQAREKGICISEPSEGSVTTEDFAKASARWLKTRKVSRRQLAFLARPLVTASEPFVRTFVARLQNEIIGFIRFDPAFSRSTLVGYCANISRATESFRQGLHYAIMLEAIAQFKKEDVRWMHLGLSPLSRRVVAQVHPNPILDFLLRIVFQRGNRLYNFRGIEFTKSRFFGQETPVYLVQRRRLPLTELFAIFRLSHVI
jgi:phosphatidylglycerol lysyltransferase